MANTFNCPSCGAPLEIEDDEQMSVVCKYCGDTVAVPAEFRHHVDEAPLLPPEDAEEPAPAPAPDKNLAAGIAIFVFLGFFLFFVLFSRPKTPARYPTSVPASANSNSYIYLLATKEAARMATSQVEGLATQQADSATARALSIAATLTATNEPETLYSHRVYAPVIIPEAADTAYPDFLVQDYYGYFVWADGAKGTVLWKSDPLSGHGSQARGFVVEKQALIIDLTSISALDLQTGKTAWKAALTNGLGNCVTCVVQSGATLLVLLKDGTLQALDTASGQLTWHKTLKGTYTDLFLTGGLPALIVQAGGRSTLSVLDPLTGNVSRTIQPTCLGGSKVSAVMNLVDLGAGNKELFVLGAGCVQILSLPDGKLMAQVTDRQYAAHADSIWQGNSYLVSARTVYYASASKSINALDLASGASSELLSAPNADLKPLTISGNILLVGSQSSSDSVHQYWGIDLTSGQNLWNFPVEGQANVHLLADGNLYLYKWLLGTHVWTLINPQTGKDVYQIEVMSGGGLSYEFTWYRDIVYIIRDHKLMIMNAQTGQGIFY